MALGIPPSLLGMRISGDIAGYTGFTDRHGRNSIFPAAPPKVPRSTLQAVQRARFAATAASWSEASAPIHAAYERASKALSLMMTGYNLWVLMAFRQDVQLKTTLERQSRETLPMPPDPRDLA